MAAITNTPTFTISSPDGFKIFSPERSVQLEFSGVPGVSKWTPSQNDSIEWLGTSMYVKSKDVSITFAQVCEYYLETLEGSNVGTAEESSGVTFLQEGAIRTASNGYVVEECKQWVIYDGHAMPLHNAEASFQRWTKEGKIKAVIDFAPANVKVVMGSRNWWSTAKKGPVRAIYTPSKKNGQVGTVFFDKPFKDAEGREGSLNTFGDASFAHCGGVTHTKERQQLLYPQKAQLLVHSCHTDCGVVAGTLLFVRPFNVSSLAGLVSDSFATYVEKAKWFAEDWVEHLFCSPFAVWVSETMDLWSLERLRKDVRVFVDVSAEENFRGFPLEPVTETPNTEDFESKVALFGVYSDKAREIQTMGIQALTEAVLNGGVSEMFAYFDGLLDQAFKHRELRLKSVEVTPTLKGPCDPALEFTSKYLFVLCDKDMCKVIHPICRSIGRDRLVEIPAFKDAKKRHEWLHKLGGEDKCRKALFVWVKGTGKASLPYAVLKWLAKRVPTFYDASGTGNLNFLGYAPTREELHSSAAFCGEDKGGAQKTEYLRGIVEIEVWGTWVRFPESLMLPWSCSFSIEEAED